MNKQKINHEQCWPQPGESTYPAANDPKFKDLSADEFYRLEYIERLKSLNDIEEWED